MRVAAQVAAAAVGQEGLGEGDEGVPMEVRKWGRESEGSEGRWSRWMEEEEGRREYVQDRVKDSRRWI